VRAAAEADEGAHGRAVVLRRGYTYATGCLLGTNGKHRNRLPSFPGRLLYAGLDCTARLPKTW
ncbi:hypothetical protein, partial [Bacteroides zoogleoformans]|uniref:hypothetical protein n=1 Tax=Bacteroides zoogleoformans TaxID=28119 RepID=UPI00248DF2BC